MGCLEKNNSLFEAICELVIQMFLLLPKARTLVVIYYMPFPHISNDRAYYFELNGDSIFPYEFKFRIFSHSTRYRRSLYVSKLKVETKNIVQFSFYAILVRKNNFCNCLISCVCMQCVIAI